MRNLSTILKAFAGAAAVSTLVACEEVPSPKPSAAPVASAPAAPKPVAVAQPTPAPKPVEVAQPLEAAQPVLAEADGDGDDDPPDAVLAKARDAIKAGALGRALKLAQVAVGKAPRRSAAWNTLGRAQLASGRRADALASFEKAVALNPKSSYAHNNLGLALIYDHRYDEAIEALEDAVSLEPVEGYMWNNLGMAYEHLDRLEEARDAYRKAAALDNDRAGQNLARLEGVKSVFRSARADVDHAPEDGGAW